MMEWYQILSYFFTNGIRAFLCLCLTAEVLDSQRNTRKTALFSVGAAIIITLLPLISLSQSFIIGVEIVVLCAAARLLFKEKSRMSLFRVMTFRRTASTLLAPYLVGPGRIGVDNAVFLHTLSLLNAPRTGSLRGCRS